MLPEDRFSKILDRLLEGLRERGETDLASDIKKTNRIAVPKGMSPSDESKYRFAISLDCLIESFDAPLWKSRTLEIFDNKVIEWVDPVTNRTDPATHVRPLTPEEVTLLKDLVNLRERLLPGRYKEA